jgi:glycine cleavage system H protein
MSFRIYVWRKGNSWVKIIDKEIVTVGVLPEAVKDFPTITVFRFLVGRNSSVKQAGRIASIVYKKTTIFVESPLSGTVVELNEKLLRDPSPIKTDPLNEGWLIRIKPEKISEELKTLEERA